MDPRRTLGRITAEWLESRRTTWANQRPRDQRSSLVETEGLRKSENLANLPRKKSPRIPAAPSALCSCLLCLLLLSAARGRTDRQSRVRDVGGHEQGWWKQGRWKPWPSSWTVLADARSVPKMPGFRLCSRVSVGSSRQWSAGELTFQIGLLPLLAAGALATFLASESM